MAPVPVGFGYAAGADPRTYGMTCTRADTTTCALYRDVNGIWQTAAADVPRYTHYQYNGTTNVVTLLREGAGTNSALGSCSYSDATYWSNMLAYTRTAKTSCISGQTAQQVTGTTGGIAQVIGTFVNGQTDCESLLIENVDSVTSNIRIYDTTAAAYAITVLLTWATKSASITAGAGTCGVIDLGTGPNGGALVRLWLTFTGTAAGTGANGNTRRYEIYPTSSAGTNAILHHAQFEANASYPSSPIVTVAGAVTRAADLISVPWSRNPEAGTWYLSAYDLKASAATQTALWLGKNDASTAPYFSIADASTKWQSRVAMAAGNSDSAAATATTYGQLVELRPILAVSGGNITSQLGQSINGAAEAVAAAGTARALDAAYASPTRAYIGTTGAGTLGANLAIRSLCYVPGPETSMAVMRTLSPPSIVTQTNTLSPISLTAERSWFGQPMFTVKDTGTGTLLSASATPRADQLVRIFKLNVSFSISPNAIPIWIYDGDSTIIWQGMTSATGRYVYHFDFSKKPLRGSRGNVVYVITGSGGAANVGTVSFDGDFVRAP